MISKWTTNMNNGDLTGPLRSPKSIWFGRTWAVTKKLSMYRVSEQSFIWFRSYLTDRQQVVKYKQSVSEPQHVMPCVPRGSILGPLLFIIYIGHITLHVCWWLNRMCYRQDNGHFWRKLKADTDKIVIWCDENRMATNDQNTTSMLRTTYQKFYKQLNVFIWDYKLKVVRVEQLLGVSIDQNLSVSLCFEALWTFSNGTAG